VDEEEVRRLRTQIKLLQRRLRRETFPEHGLSRTALQVLAATVRFPGTPQPRHLAEELMMTSSNVAAALRELEAAGHVRRRKDAADARRVLVLATEQGEAVVAGVRNDRDSWLGRAVETLLDPGEQRLLLAAGELMQRLAEFEPEPAPALSGSPAAAPGAGTPAASAGGTGTGGRAS
jgi:DNA-binding MarR family transcriptional regulator